MKQRTRKKPQERKEEILAAACRIAVQVNYTNVTRNAVAKEAGVSMGLVTTYFSTMGQLKRDIMRFAVRERIPEILAQGLAQRDSQALKVPCEDRKVILNQLAES